MTASKQDGAEVFTLPGGDDDPVAPPPRGSSPPPPSAPKVPFRDHVNALHMRFGEQAAKARVERAEMDAKAERRQSKAEASSKIRQASEDAARGEELRKNAARRVASERRLREEAFQQEEEARLANLCRRDSSGKQGRQYAKSAARRARSESVRRRDEAAEVMAAIAVEQQQRDDASEVKARLLQKRCEDGDFADCSGRPALRKKRVDMRPSRSLPPRGPRHFAPGDEGVASEPLPRKVAAGAGGCAPLPRIGHSPRGHAGAPPRQASLKPVSGAVTHLPQLVRA